MRYGILMALLTWCSLSYPQAILKHEKKIDIAQSFLSREINFISEADNIFLSGSLIQPKSDFQKIVIIVPGSGKDTRHSHHQLALKLLEQNIAVYRFDDRGVGKSHGVYSNSVNTLAKDVLAAVKRLQNKFAKRKEIGLIGHSLGGMAAVMAKQMAEKSDIKINFLVQMATPIDGFANATKYQIQTLSYFEIPNKSKVETLNIFEHLLEIVDKNAALSISQIQKKGYQYLNAVGVPKNDIKFWSYSHILLYRCQIKEHYKDLDIPTLYLIGRKDNYVNALEQINWLKNLENPKVQIQFFNDLNHYLSRENIKSKGIYAIDKKASESIIRWIQRI